MAGRGDDPSGSAHGGTSGQGDVPRALSYLLRVKNILEPEKYTEVLKALDSVKDQRIDLKGLCARVKELFVGHHYLIPGFNSFLPKGYEIKLSGEEKAALYLAMTQSIHHKAEQCARAMSHSNVHTYNALEVFAYQSFAPHTSRVNDALCYLGQVRAAFQDHAVIYYELIETFKNCRITMAELMCRLKDLLEENLEDYHNLIAGLNTRFPELYKTNVSVPVGHTFLLKYSDELLLAKLEYHELRSLKKLLNEYKPPIEVFNEAKVLLKDDPVLLEGLRHLLLEATSLEFSKALQCPPQAASKTSQAKSSKPI